MKINMTHGSLFSGIGGFELAAEWAGWENVFHCECNEFGKKVLKYYWPKSISYYDITKTNFTIHKGKIDVLTGGFPCQPYSQAGKRQGNKDDRHLWPEMLRAIREIQPRWIVGENVRGLTNWNGGMVFNEVQIDLEAEGYEVTPFLLPASAINAPHRRDRIFFIAHSNCNGCNQRNSNNEFYTSKTRFNAFNNIKQSNGNENVTHTYIINGKAQQQRNDTKKEIFKFNQFCRTQNEWQNFPIEHPVCNGNDGISKKLDGITFPKWRKETIKAAGNAVVPQLVYQIFKTINKYEQLHN